jgi:GntR family transcriptional regulator, transcriptional repressor for pyruvate dehydrogenase complex
VNQPSVRAFLYGWPHLAPQAGLGDIVLVARFVDRCVFEPTAVRTQLSIASLTSWLVEDLQNRMKVIVIILRIEKDEVKTYRTMQVVDCIRSLMEDGTLGPGDKIPPEREFARSLKISRASLRTGIGYMAAMGVIKVRRGVGTFVADGPPEFCKASLRLIGVPRGFHPWQMFEARISLEGQLAALAAERSNEEHHAALAEEVTEMFAAVNSPSDFLIHELLFHGIVWRASANPIMAGVIETIVSALYDKHRETAEHSADLRESSEMHCEIYRAIRVGNQFKARKLMEQHLRAAQTAQNMECPYGP